MLLLTVLASLYHRIASHYLDPHEIMAMDDLTDLGCEGAGKHPWEL